MESQNALNEGCSKLEKKTCTQKKKKDVSGLAQEDGILKAIRLVNLAIRRKIKKINTFTAQFREPFGCSSQFCNATKWDV